MNSSRILPIWRILFLFLFASFGIHELFLFVQNLAPRIYSYSYSREKKIYSLITECYRPSVCGMCLSCSGESPGLWDGVDCSLMVKANSVNKSRCPGQPSACAVDLPPPRAPFGGHQQNCPCIHDHVKRITHQLTKGYPGGVIMVRLSLKVVFGVNALKRPGTASLQCVITMRELEGHQQRVVVSSNSSS